MPMWSAIITREKGDVLNPQLESEATLEKIKANLGSYNFSAQYQQEPIPESGNIINWDWFQSYSEIPTATRFSRVIQSWDTAMKAHDGSDYSACITMMEVDSHYYILDAYRGKLDFPSLKKKVIDYKERFEADSVVIEDKNSGTSLIQQLRSEGIFCIEYKPEGTKADRMVAQSAAIEAGRVHLPKEAPWLDDLQSEIVSFPYGRNDDQVDALSQALHWLTTRSISILDVL
jgi:predicted phage terminase large subunit-like protein